MAVLALCCCPGLSLVAVTGDCSPMQGGVWASHRRGFSLQSVGSRVQASVVSAHGLSCLVACGMFPDQDQICVPCTSTQILNHRTIREVLVNSFSIRFQP